MTERAADLTADAGGLAGCAAVFWDAWLDAVPPRVVELFAANLSLAATRCATILWVPRRGRAVAAARNKAELYAEAAGARHGHVAHINYVDPENVGFERYGRRGADDQASAEGHAPRPRRGLGRGDPRIFDHP